MKNAESHKPEISLGAPIPSASGGFQSAILHFPEIGILTVSVLLVGAGGAMGITISFLLLYEVLTIHTPVVPRIEQTGIDGAVLAYSLLVSAVIGVLFGLAPAIEATRVDVTDGYEGAAAPPVAVLAVTARFL